jgi:DNA-binding transcriptional MerR regulator
MISDSDIITLKDAAQHFGFSVYTLRYEAKERRLAIYKIGKRLYTTPADIKEMVNRCRVDQKAHDFTLIRGGSSGLSETDRRSSALAAANETAQKLKNSSRSTLGKSIALPRRVRP